MHTARISTKCTHTRTAQKAYELFTKLQTKPDFLSLADETAKPRQDMNVKVAAFTVSEKFTNTYIKCGICENSIYPDQLPLKKSADPDQISTL